MSNSSGCGFLGVFSVKVSPLGFSCPMGGPSSEPHSPKNIVISDQIGDGLMRMNN